MRFRPSVTSPSGLRHAIHRSFALTGLFAALIAGPVFADDAADIAKLMRAGQYAEALTKVDAVLAKTPRDPQTRFLKGVILTEQNKPQDAISVFTRLTEDFPDLPEPYNNLAVLYASSGQYDKARTSLEMAIRTNPTYATAYENLGDVHARLASQAYDKALQLDSANTGAKSKLTMVRTLVGNTTGGTNPKTGAATAAPIVKAAPAAPIVVAKAEPAKPSAAAPVPEPVKAAPAPKPEPVKAASSPKPEPVKAAPAKNDEQDDVMDVVNAWAKAWSARDIKSYLNYYGNDFQPGKGESRKAWADERTARIVGKGSISVGIQSPRVSINGNTATVKFRQSYASGSLKSDTRKTLILNKQNGKWQINQERTGS